jgi:flagellar motility protein MotE (MotC chaperone)
MNASLIAVLLLALTQQQSDTSALVEASKEARAKRKGSTTKVITNDDVKKSDKKKIIKTPGEAAPVEPSKTLMEKHEAERTARLVREEKLKVLNEHIAVLEKELAKLEQSYYEANDLNYRDTVIVKRFNETRAKLDDARKQLE